MNKAAATRLFVACVIAISIVLSIGPASNPGALAAQQQATAATVARNYVTILNAANQNGDFSALSRVFAPSATLRWTNPSGQTLTFHGIAAITHFHQGLHTKVPTFQWTVVSMNILNKNVIMTYEHAGPPSNPTLGSCAHIYVVKHGKIVSYDWIIYR